MNTRIRILLAIGFSIVVLVLGYLLYIVFFAPETPRTQPTRPTDPSPFEEGAFPSGGDAPDRIILTPEEPSPLPTGTDVDTEDTIGVDRPVVGLGYSGQVSNPTLGRDGSLQFYDTSDGIFYTLDENGNVRALSDEVFYNVDTVTWANERDIAVIEYPDGANIVYNFETDSQVTLPKHWEDFDFDRNGSEIAAKSIGISDDNQWLVTADTDGKNITLVEPMGDNADKVIVDWSPSGQILGFARTGDPLGNDRQEIFLVGQHGENFKSLVVEGRDFRPEWSPSGEKLLYSVYSERTDFRPELWVVNASGNTVGEGRRYLNIGTWANKCAFGSSDTYVYCGVPVSLSRGAGFVPESADTTEDLMYRINIQTGARTVIPLGEGTYTIETVTVNEDSQTLYFTDKNRSGIFEVEL